MNIKTGFKKCATAFVVAGIVASSVMPGFASAQTSLEANLKLITDLTNQIKALQAQILGLQTQQKQLQATTSQTVLEIMQNLKEGSEGDQVTLLQTLLAADAAMYPEGKVTGFFGPATRRALQRFQKANGLEQVGFVGPRTRAVLNEWINKQFKSVSDIENELDDDIADEIEDAIASITLPALPSDPCGIPSLPSGGPIRIKDGKVKLIQTGNVFIYQDGKHKIVITPNTYHEKDGKKKLIITPGMRIEKDGKSKIIVPCNGNGTTTPPVVDTTAPVISSINSSVTHQSATVSWITNEAANSKVYFGTTTPLNTSSAQTVSKSIFETGHSLSLTSLTAATQYYFVIETKDVKGNTATSSQGTFTTTASPDTTAPTITAISATNVGTSTVTISWTTNESSNSKVYYSTATPLNTSTASTKSDAMMVMSHSVTLTGLTPNTTHYFKVESKDAANNSSTGSETSFVTVALPVDSTAPVISALSTTPASTTASVLWTTNEAATTKVYYGTVTPLVLGSASTVTDATLLTSHTASLTGLTASTTYYMVVESKDAANNTATSSEASFVTTN
jgi:hypothetical protein